jgi:hypothetical protein
MTHLLRAIGSLVVFGALSFTSYGQSASGSASTQSSSPTASPATGGGTQDGTTAGTDAKKKKVWTNDDVGGLSGPVSVVGGTSKKPGPTSTTGGTADPQYIAETKKQLGKLQSQLDDTKKELTAYQEFQQGKTPEPTGYPIGKGYNRVPVDQQIATLQEKKKDLEQKISDLLDEARKKGVLPGQLR